MQGPGEEGLSQAIPLGQALWLWGGGAHTACQELRSRRAIHACRGLPFEDTSRASRRSSRAGARHGSQPYPGEPAPGGHTRECVAVSLAVTRTIVRCRQAMTQSKCALPHLMPPGSWEAAVTPCWSRKTGSEPKPGVRPGLLLLTQDAHNLHPTKDSAKMTP